MRTRPGDVTGTGRAARRGRLTTTTVDAAGWTGGDEFDPTMEVWVDVRGPAVDVRVAGCLDAGTVAVLGRILSDSVEHHRGGVTVGLDGLTTVDAEALGTLAGLAAHAHRRGRRLVLDGVPAPGGRSGPADRHGPGGDDLRPDGPRTDGP